MQYRYVNRFNHYQEQTRETAIYPGAGTGSIQAILYLGLGLGEAGEVQGKLKKVLRDDNGEISTEKRQAVLDELGDVLWYVARLADELKMNMDELASNNLTKLFDRKDRGVISGSGDAR